VKINIHFQRDILKFHSGVGNFRFDVDIFSPPRVASFGLKTSSSVAPTSSYIVFLSLEFYANFICGIEFEQRYFSAD